MFYAGRVESRTSILRQNEKHGSGRDGIISFFTTRWKRVFFGAGWVTRGEPCYCRDKHIDPYIYKYINAWQIKSGANSNKTRTATGGSPPTLERPRVTAKRDPTNEPRTGSRRKHRVVQCSTSDTTFAFSKLCTRFLGENALF